MNLENKRLDQTDWKILQLLQENARISYTEIGRQVGLSLPAAAERVRRLEEGGIIEGYHAQINPEKIGLSVVAFIQVHVPVEKYPQFTALVADLSEVIEGYHVTGVEAFVLKVMLASISDLEALVNKLSRYGQTTTSIVLSTPLKRRMVVPGNCQNSATL
jgi:Lrp/AsnC family leucine-responsive transcriptional regulator